MTVWLRVVALIAGLKVGLGLLGFAAGAPLAGTRPERDVVYLAHVLVFAMSATGLALGGRADRRALRLALFYLLISSVFADRLLLRLGVPFPTAAGPLLLLGHVQVEAFLPYVLWLFVRDFPRAPLAGREPRLLRTALAVTLASGAVLLLVNLYHAAALLGGWHTPLARVASAFGRYENHTVYQAVLFSLMLPTLAFLVWKAHRSPPDERRRVWLLLAGLVAGATPVILAVILMSFWPAADAVLSEPRVFRWLEVLVYTGTLSIPVTTAYAVLVQHALDVRLVVRKAVRYALAKYTALTLAVAPLGALVILLVLHRDQSLATLLTGPRGLVLTLAGVLGLVMLGVRRRLMAEIDRRFFREQYDANRILHALAEGSRSVSDAGELEELLLRETDRALHLETGALLVRLPETELLVSPSERARSLGLASELARSFTRSGEPMAVRLAGSDPTVEALPIEDRQWLADGGFRLLLPLLRTTGDLAGILALGGKRSELPFTREDHLLLATVASSARVTLENRILPALTTVERDDTEREAAECRACGAIWPAEERQCPRCAGWTQPSQVPQTLRAKFRLEQRIGRGGMGVVYRATDLHLGRQVAVKTLPWVEPYLTMRLRREARAMAAVSHPNLAMIYGVEFFHGIPILVVEYLAGGTLADRLRNGPMPWPEAVALGVALADAVDRIHAAGILHRDIKPSNVGFAADGVPKLLDFGLARAIEAARGLELAATPVPLTGAQPAPFDGADVDDLTGPGTVAGTAAYLSPEAVNGHAPDPSFDLWGVSIVLYEAIAGSNPMKSTSYAQTAYKVLYQQIPDIRDAAPSCPPELAAFFRDALHLDPRRRPESGSALARRLRDIQAR